MTPQSICRKWLPLCIALLFGMALGWGVKGRPDVSATTHPPVVEAVGLHLSQDSRMADVGDGASNAALFEELLDELARRDAEIEALRAALKTVETKYEALASEVDQLNREWVFSYGSTVEAGKFVGELLRDSLAMRQMDRDDPERVALATGIFLKFSSLGPILQEMQNLDDKPGEFAEFRAAILGEAIGLDPATQERVQQVIANYKARALQLESGDARAALNAEASSVILDTLTAEQRDQIDNLSSARFNLLADPLETPSLDPRQWGRSR